MGMGFPFGGSSYGRAASGQPIAGDPIPARFRILRVVSRYGLVAAEIVWPDAKNYDGRKILVYRCTESALRNARALDPHFQERRGPLVPIARFEPTDEGWAMASALVLVPATSTK